MTTLTPTATTIGYIAADTCSHYSSPLLWFSPGAVPCLQTELQCPPKQPTLTPETQTADTRAQFKS